jgi:hypothetical protein
MEPIVVLRMDVLGVIDFDAGTIAVDATLRDSRILELVNTGDIALRMSWGREPLAAPVHMRASTPVRRSRRSGRRAVV